MSLPLHPFHNFDANIRPFTHLSALKTEEIARTTVVLTPNIETNTVEATRAVNQVTPTELPRAAPKVVPSLPFLRRLDPDVDRLITGLEAPATNTELSRTRRNVDEYMRSRGRNDAVGMRASNREDVDVGQVWRPIAATVHENLMQVSNTSDKSSKLEIRRPFVMFPAWIRPECQLIWRDIYDNNTATIDPVTSATTMELVAAGRTAYNWLSRRHRDIISADTIGYLSAVMKAISSGESLQFKNCYIDPIPFCDSQSRNVKRESIIVAHIWLALLLRKQDAVYKYKGEQNFQNEDAIVVLDHGFQLATLHVRGSWGGDVIISDVRRRRSEVLNFVPHGSIVIAFGEIRSCPCCVNGIMTTFAQTIVTESDIRACDRALRNPGLVHFSPGFFILAAYIILFLAALVATLHAVFLASKDYDNGKNDSTRLERLNAGFGAVTWSIAIITSLHVIVTRNVLPGIELRQLAQSLRYTNSLDDMRLSQGAMICLAQDPRTNHVLAPGNACAYAHRPSGSVNVSTLPNAREAWSLGLVLTNMFAIKLEQGTPLVRKVVKNLDGSVFVDWDTPVFGTLVGKILDSNVLVG